MLSFFKGGQADTTLNNSTLNEVDISENFFNKVGLILQIWL